jgi:hypothetical protein
MVQPIRPFSFETSFDGRDSFPSLRRSAKPKFGVGEDQLFVGFAFLGALCLLWKYTIALGAGVLAMTTFAWAMRERGRKWRTAYREVVEPPGIIRVGANENGYWIRGDGFFAENRWDGVLNALEADGYLIVQARRMPRVQFPIDELHAAGVYDQLRAIVDARTALYRETLARLGQESGG